MDDRASYPKRAGLDAAALRTRVRELDSQFKAQRVRPSSSARR